MAAAHVSGVAAMVLAAGVVSPTSDAAAGPGRARSTQRLRATARNIGLPATQQGAGLIDAGPRHRRQALTAAPQVVRTMITLQGA